MSSSVVRHLPRQLRPLTKTNRERAVKRRRRETMKGICVEHFNRLFVWTRYTTETARLEWAFVEIWCSDSKKQQWMFLQLGNIKVPCPVWVTLTYKGRKNKRNRKSNGEKRQVEVVFIKDSTEYQTFWVSGCWLEEEILLCTVQFWEGRCAATYKLFIRVDVCFLSLPVPRKK